MYKKSHTIRLPLLHTVSTRVVFFVLCALLISIFALYVYFINKTVANVVVRERIERDIAALSSTIGELEFEYISLKNSVTIDLARAKGFEDASPTFISRTGGQLSYNDR